MPLGRQATTPGPDGGLHRWRAPAAEPQPGEGRAGPVVGPVHLEAEVDERRQRGRGGTGLRRPAPGPHVLIQGGELPLEDGVEDGVAVGEELVQGGHRHLGAGGDGAGRGGVDAVAGHDGGGGVEDALHPGLAAGLHRPSAGSGLDSGHATIINMTCVHVLARPGGRMAVERRLEVGRAAEPGSRRSSNASPCHPRAT